jgi:hypothetical protein
MMASMPRTNQKMSGILESVGDTKGEVARSKTAMAAMRTQTGQLVGILGKVATSTHGMRGAVEGLDSKTSKLVSIIDDMNTKVTPLAKTQHSMLGDVVAMKGGTVGMNNSLAYVIRQLNYMTAPPNGESFKMAVELDKKALPPVPGIVAKTAPIAVFDRGAWPVYTGP